MVTEGDTTNILYNYIAREFHISKVIVEKKIEKKSLLKNRIKKTGLLNVIGQVLFLLTIPLLLRTFSKKRRENIIKSNALDVGEIPKNIIQEVNSVNDKKTIQFLQSENPDIIIVNGTRIISKEVIKSTPAKLINIHTGITPGYRGVHGGYWALAMNDKENCGVTIHYIDEGIDTGFVLAQKIIYPSKEDNFTSYPYLQFAEGIKLMRNAVKNILENTKEEMSFPKGKSKLWYHPTLWMYLYYFIKRGVK